MFPIKPNKGVCPAMPASPMHIKGLNILYKKSSVDTNAVNSDVTRWRMINQIQRGSDHVKEPLGRLNTERGTVPGRTAADLDGVLDALMTTGGFHQ